MKKLETSIVISAVGKEDIPSLHRNLNDPGVCRFLYVDYPVSLEEILSYWNGKLHNDLFHAWAARAREDRQLLGVVSLMRLEERKVKHNASLSLVVGRPYWNQGVGSALLRFVLQEAGRLQIKRIGLSVRSSHQSALKLYEKHGFRVCGRRIGFFKDEAGWIDDLEMERFLKETA